MNKKIKRNKVTIAEKFDTNLIRKWEIQLHSAVTNCISTIFVLNLKGLENKISFIFKTNLIPTSCN